MGERRTTLIVVLFCLCLPVFASGIVYASSENWVEVKRFTGIETTSEITTEPFTCDHVEWRIRWNFSTVFRMHQKTLGVFGINVFEKEPKRHVSSFVGVPTIGSENGTLSLSENGTFYLQIHVLNIYDYSILIEQNIDSIPEFPSWTPLLIMLVAVIAVIVIFRRSLHKQNQGRRKQ